MHARRALQAGGVTLATLLVCTGGGGQSVSPASAASPEAPTEQVTLDIMVAYEPGWDALVPAFEAANPGIKINMESVPYEQFHQKWGVYAAAGDSGPDWVELDGTLNIQQNSPSLAPLNDSFSPEFLAGFTGSRSGCEGSDCTTGKVIGVPMTVQAYPVYYNKAVLREAGLPDTAPTTWREFDAACSAVKAIGKSCVSIGLKSFGGTLAALDLAYEVATQELVDGLADGGAKLTDRPLKGIFEILDYMFKNGYTQPDATSSDITAAGNMLFAGESAFFGGGLLATQATGFAACAKALGEDCGIMTWPAIEADFPVPGLAPGPEAGKSGPVPGWFAATTAWADQPDAAATFTKWLLSSEAQGMRLVNEGIWPSLLELDTTAITVPAGFENAQAFVANAAGITPLYDSLRGDTFAQLDPQIQLLYLGEATVDQVVDTLQQAQDAGIAQ